MKFHNALNVASGLGLIILSSTIFPSPNLPFFIFRVFCFFFGEFQLIYGLTDEKQKENVETPK